MQKFILVIFVRFDLEEFVAKYFEWGVVLVVYGLLDKLT